MTHIISLSGGSASFASACIAYESGLDFAMVFADTLIEDEDLYRFLGDIEQALGRKIIRLADGRTPWQVFRDVGFIGNSRTAHCSQLLKRKVILDWMTAHCDPARDVLVIGMGLDEPERLARAQKAWAPWRVTSLLIERGWSSADVSACYARYGIEKPRLYGMGWSHNNCGGFCVRAGQATFANLLRHFPERYAEHEAEEAKSLASIKGALPILRDWVDGETRGITLRQFRERREIQPDMFDWGGCGCFTEDAA